MQGIFEPGFASHRIKLQSKTQDHHLNNLSTNKIGRGEGGGGEGVGKLYT